MGSPANPSKATGTYHAPLVGAFAGGAMAGLALGVGPGTGSLEALFGAAASTWAGLLGFVLAAQSILIGFWGAPILRTVREKSDLRRGLWSRFHLAVYVLGAATLIAFLSLLPWGDRMLPVLVFVNAVASGGATGAIVGCVKILREVTDLVMDPPTADDR